MNLVLDSKFVILLFSILYICSFNNLISAQKKKNAKQSDETICDKNTRKRVDELLAKVTTYGNSGRKFPENSEQLPKYCNESKTLVENIEALNKKCMDGLPKRVLTVSIFTVKSVIRQLCKKTNKLLPDYFEAARCINTVQSQVGKCFSKSIDHLLGMQFAVENQKIPMACCELPKVRHCIEDVQQDIDICTEKNVESTNKFVDSIIGNSVNLLACGEYIDGSDKCDKFSVPKKKKNQRRPKSLIMAFLHLIESFPEDDRE